MGAGWPAGRESPVRDDPAMPNGFASLPASAAGGLQRRQWDLSLAGSPVGLRAARTVWLAEFDTLLVADAHFGKDQAFRRAGIPVPAGAVDDNLAALTAEIEATGARRLVFLGDLLHARQSRSPFLDEAVHRWRETCPSLSVTLVRGNHDVGAGDPPPRWRFDIVDEPHALGPFALCHHPQRVAGRYVWAGHVHPALVVGRGRDRLRLPCFHLSPRMAVLPAFGVFTGMHPVDPQPGDRVIAIAGGQLREIPLAGAAGIAGAIRTLAPP